MISDVYFPRINGVSTSIQTFKQELESLGHKVYLIAPEYPEAADLDSTILRISSKRVVFDPEDRMMRFSEILANLEQLRQLNFDIVHIHTPFVAHYAGVRIARELSLPCVATYHTLFEEYLYHYIPWLPKQLLRYGARRFSVSQCNQLAAAIAPSSVIVSLLTDYGVKCRLEILPTGIKAEMFAKGDGRQFRRRLGIDSAHKVLLNVSRIAFEKNIGLLLDMFAEVHDRVPETHLVIAGEGPARESCIARVRELQLEDCISFVGYLDRNAELIDCYHAADLFVFASETETQGLVLLEAMAAGVPVVSVAAMGTKDVLKEGAGVSITDNTVADFSTKVCALLDDARRCEKLGESAIHYAKTWDAQSCARKLLGFYQEVCLQQKLPAESLA